MWHLLDAIQGTNVIERIDGGRQTSVQAKNLVLDQCGEREIVKQVGEVFPDVGVAILPKALVIESIDLSDLSTLMVAAKNRHAIFVSNLEGDEQRDGFDGIITAVNIVSHEQIIGVWARSADPHQLVEIVQLPVNVATHSDGTAHTLDIRLLLQNLLGLLTKHFDVCL